MILLIERLVRKSSKYCATSNRRSAKRGTESIIYISLYVFTEVVLVYIREALLVDLWEAEAVSCDH